jgi:hypothetical protein
MKKVQGTKTDTQFADELGISKQYLCDLYNGRKVPSANVSALLGYEQQVETRYVPAGSGAKEEASRGKEPKTTRSRKRNSG